MNQALITGVHGFVGTHMHNYLSSLGWGVVGFDLNRGSRYDVRFIMEEDQDPQWSNYDLVVHCAAVVGGRQTISNDPMAVAIDLEIDACFFRWVMRNRPKRVVYFSSSAAYPVALQESYGYRLKESDIDLNGSIGLPDLTYGWSKVTGEILAQYVKAAGIPVSIFRPFSGYGPGQALDYPFPSYIKRGKEHQDPFEIWGGNQARDFVHIDDVVRTVMAAVYDGYEQPLNIGTGRLTRFTDLASMVAEEAGYEPAANYRQDMPIGPFCRVADVTEMNKVRPAKITLEEGIREALGG